MLALTEKIINYGLDINLRNNRKYKEINPKLIDTFLFKKFIGKIRMKNSFCGFCEQVVVNSTMASPVSPENLFAKVIKLI